MSASSTSPSDPAASAPDVSAAPADQAGMDYFGPRPSWQILDGAELWRYRELGYVLALRDFKVRYRQALIGAAWAIVQPVSTLLIFQVLFALLQKTPTSGSVPYPITALCGLVPWYFFATIVRDSSDSLVNNRHILTKIYFPRLLLPLGTSLVALVDFLMGLLVLFGVMFYFGYGPQGTWLWLPLLSLLTLGIGLSLGIWLSALHALFRDVKYLIPFALQLGFYLTPTFYEQNSLIPASWQWLHALNPMVSLIGAFRWALIHTPFPPLSQILISLTGTLLLFLGGLLFFRRIEGAISDRI